MKQIISSVFVALSLISLNVQGADDVLRFSYWDDAKPPFILERDGVVHSGIIKDLADKVALATGVPVEMVKLPVARIEPQLQSGEIDIDCLTSPIWKESPGSYNWSPVLFRGADRFLAHPDFSEKLHSFVDLKGATLGIYNAYVYHPEIMRMIDNGDVATIKVKGIEHGLQLLKLKRLDALIDFGVLLKYQLREKGLTDQLVLADLPADEFDLHCAYSKKMNISAGDLNLIFTELKKKGELDKILNQYQ